MGKPVNKINGKDNMMSARALLTACGVVLTALLPFAGDAWSQAIVMKMSTATLNDTQHEWMKRFAAAIEKNSNGRIKGEVYPASQLGAIPRQIEGTQLGSVQAWIGPPEFMVGIDTRYELLSVPGLFKSDDQVIKTIADPEFSKAFLALGANKGLVGVTMFPSGPMAFLMRTPMRTLADLKGKKIRVQGVSQSDIAKAFGASAVTIPFGEVVPALEKGVVDCGITGTMPAYQAKWPEVVKTLLALPVGYTAAFWAINLNAWGKLSKPTQDFMLAEFKKLEDMSWAIVENESIEGIACNTGTGPCSIGPPAKLKLVKPSDADIAARNKALNEVVLVEWAKRCGAECAAKWTEVVGKQFGLAAKAN
jgi:TRAP-type C4-dicarboxylate transport system substrate-binding protein